MTMITWTFDWRIWWIEICFVSRDDIDLLYPVWITEYWLQRFTWPIKCIT